MLPGGHIETTWELRNLTALLVLCLHVYIRQDYISIASAVQLLWFLKYPVALFVLIEQFNK